MAAIDNCVSSNYLRRACTDSSSVAGGGNVNKSNLCSTLNDVACDVTFSSLTVTGSSSLNNVTATGLSTLYDLTVTNDTLLNNGTFTGDIKINNLTVTGTQYIEHRKDLYIGDPLITLNSGVAGVNTYDIGWIGERGSSINVGTIWDESDDEFALVTTTDDGSTDSVTISSYEKLKLGSIEATGKLGIGVSNPSFSFHIKDPTEANYSPSSATSSSPSGIFSYYDNDNITAGLALQGFYDRSTVSLWYLGNAGSQDQGVGAPAYSGPLVFGNRTAGSSYSEKMRIASDGKVGIATTDPIGDLSVSGSTYSEKVFHTGSDGSWLQVGTGEEITLGALSVTSASAGVPSLTYNNSNGVFTYTPPATGSMASKTAANYVLGSATGSMASKTASNYVLGSATGSMASQTSTNYVLGTATGSLASQTANITDYVLKTATGSLASQTADISDYVLGTSTGCAASKTCEYFTGQLFGYQTGAAQTLDNGDSPVWNAATSSWSYGPGGGGAGIALTDLSVTVALAGTANLSYNNSDGVFTYTPPATGTMASQTAANYVLGSATGSMASKTATDYVLGTATGSMASKTATDYVLGTSTGCAASKTCEYFTGSLFGDALKAGETFTDGYTPVWEASSSKWLLQDNSAGGTTPGGSTTEIQFNNSGAFGGSSNFTVDSASGVLTAGKADVGSWPAVGTYAFFGHADLDHTAAGNYALAQDSNGATIINAAASQYIAFRENNTNSAFISGGAMRIGNGLPSGTAGSLVVDNDVIAFYTSDERLKDNITPIASGLNKISHLTGVRFDWSKDSYAHLQGHDVGVIAQNIESVVPEAVSTRPDGYKAVRYDKIVPVLIEGMKEQQIQIQNLQTEVDSLKYWLESV